MRIYQQLTSLARLFIPKDATIFYEESSQRPKIDLLDIDQDSNMEVVVHYKWKNDYYILVLKENDGEWSPLIHERASIISKQGSSHSIEKKGEEKRSEVATHMPNYLYPAPVKTVQGTKWGYINQQGEFSIPPTFEYAQPFQENGLAVVQIDKSVGLINLEGDFIVPPKYSTITTYSEGRAAVVSEAGFEVIDESGNVVTKKPYSYIGTYSQNRALVEEMKDEKSVYGYIDRFGNEAIPLIYESGTDFKEGKAVVKKQDYQYLIIDINITKLNKFKYWFVGNLSEGLLPFQPVENGKIGFINEEGSIIITPRYTSVTPFEESRSIVNSSNSFESKFGLINRRGNYIFQRKYSSIYLIGENRVALGKAIDEEKPYLGTKYAVADIQGRILTLFKYDGITEYTKGFLSVHDENNTFFLDEQGKIARKLPIVAGQGTLSFVGNLISANVDQRYSYYGLDGNLVWHVNTVIPLNEQYAVKEVKYKPNVDYLVYYPQIKGINDKSIQHIVNNKLKELSNVKRISPTEKLDYSYTGDFSVTYYKKNLLVLQLNSYNFPLGAAHGMPSEVYVHINLETGEMYELHDLFMQNSPYVKTLTKIVSEQIKNDPQYSYVFPDSYKGISKNQPFYITEDALHLYFQPYEIAPYVAGFPTFTIPFEQVMGLIDTEGAFWQSFH